MSAIEAYNLQPYIQEAVLPKEEETKVLSFNLAAERKRARDAREKDEDIRTLAKEGFANNAAYWGKEYIAGVQTAHYYWEIIEEDGNMRLFHPEFGFADDIHKNALTENVPAFEKRRRQVEYEMSKVLPQVAMDMEPHQALIWSSPPPENIDDDVYGGYTMTHLLEATEVDGKKVLLGRDIKNYLSNDAQKEMLEEYEEEKLFESTPTALEILSTPVIPKTPVSAGSIERRIREKEEERRLGKEGGDEQVFEFALTQHQHRLETIYAELEKDNIDEERIGEMFQNWAKGVDRTYQTEKWKADTQTVDEEQIIEYGYRIESTFEDRIMQSGGSCGNEVGFGTGMEQAYGYLPTAVSPMFGRFMGNTAEKTWSYHKGNCVVCKKKNLDVGPCKICKTCEKKFD